MLPHFHTHLIDQFHLYQKQQLQRFEKLAHKMFHDFERSARDDHAHENAEFGEEMEEHKAEILLLRKDSVDELWREGQEVLDQGKEACLAFGDDINDYLSRLCDKIDGLNNLGLRKLVAGEVRRQQRRRVSVRKGVRRKGAGRKEVKGEHKLGKKRKVEEEWYDI